jgi:hypothetical protein
MRSFAAVFGLMLALVFAANNAFAILLVDIRVVSGTNGALVTDSKSVIVPDTFDAAHPATITFQIYAHFTTGTGGPTGNDTIQQIQGGMATVRDGVDFGFKGDVSPVTLAPAWSGLGSQPGVPTPNLVGDLIIPTSPPTSAWSARNPVSQPVEPVTLSTIIGTFTVTQTGLGGAFIPTTVNFTPMTGNGAGTWEENGVSYNNVTNPKAYQDYTAGAPVSIVVPEPSSLILLSLSAVGLTIFGWRKRR